MKPFLALLFTATAFSAETITNSIGMKLVPVEHGGFTMGQDGPAADYNVKKHAERFDDADWDEKPAHRVTITQSFFMSATEVTQAQFRQFRPKHADGRGADDDAAMGLTWNDAVKFCDWLSKKEGKPYRLPIEGEWEYACRAGTTTLFHTGDALPAGFHSWPSDIGLRDRFFPEDKLPVEYRPKITKLSLKVAQTPANARRLYDMHGNVSEWCADWYGPYEAGAQMDPLGRIDGEFRVIRGGAHSMQTRLLRSANRTAWLPDTQSEKTGFRVVLGEWPKGITLPLPAPQLHAQNVSRSLTKIEMPPPDVAFFDGPKPFVIIPPNSSGPLFSWHNHSPAITECPNGDLLAVWYSCVDEAGTELNNLASRLRLGAKEWEPASLFWDGADINDHAPKLWWDGDNTIYHFARGQLENVVRTSTDNGVTWSKARPIQPLSEIGNQIIRTRDGTILMTQDTTITSLAKSIDGGKTWNFDQIQDKKLDNEVSSARLVMTDRQIQMILFSRQIEKLATEVCQLEGSVDRRKRLLADAYPVLKAAIEGQQKTVIFANQGYALADFQTEVDDLLAMQDRETRQVEIKTAGLTRLKKSAEDGQADLSEMKRALDTTEQEVAVLRCRRNQANFEYGSLSRSAKLLRRGEKICAANATTGRKRRHRFDASFYGAGQTTRAMR